MAKGVLEQAMIETTQENQFSLLNAVCQQGLQQAESVLAGMVAQPITLTAGDIRLIEVVRLQEALPKQYAENISQVSMCFEGDVSGCMFILFPAETTTVLINTLTKSAMKSYEMDVFRIGTITEVGNILLSGVIAAVVAATGASLSYGVLDYDETTILVLSEHTREQRMLLGELMIQVAGLEVSVMVMGAFEAESLVQLNALLSKGETS
ncbi:MAG: hypothetical protein L3J61_05170 [Ghiorsea sp.]|nr:hypothetical protein [Ghiorsea sp.]